MKHTPSLWTIILALLLVVTLLLLVDQAQFMPVGDEHLVPPGRVRQASNPGKNRQRWLRRWAKWQWQRSQAPRTRRCRHRRPTSSPGLSAHRSSSANGVWSGQGGLASRPIGHSQQAQQVAATSSGPTDPLAELRQKRGMVDHVPERELWAMLVRVRWPDGPVCPYCGERDGRYLEILDEGYLVGVWADGVAGFVPQRVTLAKAAPSPR